MGWLRWLLSRKDVLTLAVVVVGGVAVVLLSIQIQRAIFDNFKFGQSSNSIYIATFSYDHGLYEDSLQELAKAYDIASTINDQNKRLELYGYILIYKGSCEIQLARYHYSEVNIVRANKYSNEALATINPESFPILYVGALFNLATAHHVRFINYGEQSDREASIRFYKEVINYLPKEDYLHRQASDRIDRLEGN
ncbi:hypothetical protein ACFLW4_06140 [Chloroflexota bacterium]